MRPNRLREKLNAGEPTLSTHIHTTWPSVVEALGHTGIYDYVEFVAEYAPFDLHDLDNLCRAAEPPDESGALVVESPIWGDVSGQFDDNSLGQNSGPLWVAPDQSADIFPDIVAAIEAFSNRPGNPTKTRADVEPCLLDFKINITDIVLLLDAFRGLPFPFGPGMSNCPTDPCAESLAD